MENDSLVERENEYYFNNNENRNDLIVQMIESSFLSTKIIKTIIIILIIFILIFFAETNYILNENNNLLEYKSYHISEILENFYDSIELFFYKTKPRTKNDYVYSYLTIKEYFEKNHFINSYMNMTYFFEEFHFADLAEILKEMDKNISENYEDYSQIISDIYANNNNENNNKNKNDGKENEEKNTDKYNDFKDKINFGSSDVSPNNFYKSSEFSEFKNFNFDKNKFNNFTFIDKNSNSNLESYGAASTYSSTSAGNALSKNKKIFNKIKIPNNKVILDHEHSVENKISRSSYNSDFKTQSKIQLIKNLIEFEKNSDINLLPILKNNFKLNHVNNKNNAKLNYTNEDLSFPAHPESNLYFKDLTTNIFINSFLNHYNKKYEMFNNIDSLFQSFKKNNRKFSNYSSLSDSDRILLKKEYNKKLINLLNIYENTVNFEKDDEYYFSYNKELNNKFLYFYYLMNNLTSYDFKGKWNGLNQNLYLLNNQGKIDLEIKKNFSQLKNVNLNYNIFNTNENNLIDFFDYFRNLEFSFYAIDGEYKNNWMIFNFTVNVPENFIDFVEFFEDNKKSISIKSENVTVKYFIGEFLETKTKLVCKNSMLILDFIDEDSEILKNSAGGSKKHYFSKHNNDLKFSQLKGKIVNPDCGINLEFSLEANVIDIIVFSFQFNFLFEKDFSFRVRTYSFIMIVIALFQIHFNFRFISIVSENLQQGKNMCLVTLTMNLIWNSSICSGHFFLSLTQDDFIYEYGLISISYFLLFSIFEIRLLYLSWKARNYELFYTDINAFRKKLFKFYCLIYFLLFIVLIAMRHIFVNFFMTYSYFACTWLFQIIHNAIIGTKPPMKFRYLVAISIGKIFPIIYVKGYPFNIFDLKPDFLLVFVVSITMIFQITIIELQKFIGGKFILPKFLRNKPFNYYIDFEIITNNANPECIICLESLTRENSTNISICENDVAENNSDPDMKYHKSKKIKKFFSLIDFDIRKFKNSVIDYLKSLRFTYERKNIMRTPCNHLFHNRCLEKWLELKNECPYCRREIPIIE